MNESNSSDEKQTSRPHKLMPLIAVLAVTVGLVYGLYLANRTVVAPMQGQIDARYIDVSPKILGRVAKLQVHEGDEVQIGTPLVLLDSPEVQAKVAQAQSVLAGASAPQTIVGG